MNTKMIRYILAKMLGVEALLLLLPAFVSLLYRETEGIYFLIPAAVLTVIYLLAGRKKPKQAEIYGKGGSGKRLDLMVHVRRPAVYPFRMHSELY